MGVDRFKLALDLSEPNKLPEGHFFACEGSAPYRQAFCRAAEAAYWCLPDNSFARFLECKFLLSDVRAWSSESFIQHACELTTGAGFADFDHGASVESDVELGEGRKNVDWQIKLRHWTFNVEVKCSIEEDPSSGPQEVRLSFIGRVQEPDASVSQMKELLERVGYKLRRNKHADLRMKDYLISAAQKFGTDRHLDELNVLFVTCGAPYNMNLWRGYLVGSQGLFTAKSFHDRADYMNVDVVVLSSARYLHTQPMARTASSWKLDNTYNIAVVNPRTTSRIDAECYSAFLDSFPNHTRAFNSYVPEYGAGTPLADEVKTYHFPMDCFDVDTRARMWPGYVFSRDKNTGRGKGARPH